MITVDVEVGRGPDYYLPNSVSKKYPPLLAIRVHAIVVKAGSNTLRG